MSKFEELLVNKGLYDSIDVSIEDLDELEKVLSNNGYYDYNIDCFCIKCNEKRIFKEVRKQTYEERGFGIRIDYSEGRGKTPKKEVRFQEYLNKRYCLFFQCTRDNEHSILFDLLVTNDKMIKIGQYPSFADISIRENMKYKSVLGEKFVEYKKSLGLFSHGIGIGSFVYLRRIIENLVLEKYSKVKDMLEISSEDFMHSDFKEKIEILKDYLPKVLVENKNLYSIVSKGIHELSEEECIYMYPYLKIGIELILDDIIAEKERAEKEKLFAQFVANKTGELRKNI
ncbi:MULTISPECIES: hypothetical protein [Clostridia]|jgi:hypothetical protein|uniref:Short-chain dehydrogenase n=1 Tax=Lutispora saccharofermentans TaxID=3024236 RepID=A0ABT1NJD4_9FIRM|nr:MULTISPECIES: hypothetical protein [Clostridia]MCQ1531385.1 hypothetical protein [Lutispora saccharofermentans]